RPVEFPLPILFVLLMLKFDSGLGYRDFVAYVNFNSSIRDTLGIERAPSHTLLNSALKRLDTRLIHRTQELLARKRPPPKNIAVDSSGFSHTTGGEWMDLRFKKTRKRRFHALHNVVDTDTLMVHASRVRSVPGGDAKCMIALVRRVQTSGLEILYGDKGYISKKNVQFISDIGAYAAIEPKKNARSRARGSAAYGR
ncbi:MAG: transposase, partial [Candidatus Thorarchaeota archaeon]